MALIAAAAKQSIYLTTALIKLNMPTALANCYNNMTALLHCYCLAPEVTAALQLSLKQQISQRGLVLHSCLPHSMIRAW